VEEMDTIGHRDIFIVVSFKRLIANGATEFFLSFGFSVKPHLLKILSFLVLD